MSSLQWYGYSMKKNGLWIRNTPWWTGSRLCLPRTNFFAIEIKNKVLSLSKFSQYMVIVKIVKTRHQNGHISYVNHDRKFFCKNEHHIGVVHVPSFHLSAWSSSFFHVFFLHFYRNPFYGSPKSIQVKPGVNRGPLCAARWVSYRRFESLFDAVYGATIWNHCFSTIQEQKNFPP